jgi:maleate cis-trans isomerase
MGSLQDVPVMVDRMNDSAKIALLVVPDNNTTMESEIRAYCPEIKQFLVARVPRPPGLLLVSDLPAYRASTLAAVRSLGIKSADIVIYGCTAAGFLAGPKGDTEISKALSELVGAPPITTAGAMAAALRHSSVSRVDVVTPYQAVVNDGLLAYLAASGCKISTLDSFYCNSTAELSRVTHEQVVQKAIATKSTDGEAMFIACSQLPTMRILPLLREELKYPVWSSVQASAWATLGALGMPNRHLAA